MLSDTLSARTGSTRLVYTAGLHTTNRRFGGIPPKSNMARRQSPARMARRALNVMWPESRNYLATSPSKTIPGHITAKGT
jgi:hypothetical protein